VSKVVDEALSAVTTGPDGRPLAFRWRGRLWRVIRTAEVWKEVGYWWEGEGEKTFFRLETEGGRLVEVYFDSRALGPAGSGDPAAAPSGDPVVRGTWFLYRVYD